MASQKKTGAIKQFLADAQDLSLFLDETNEELNHLEVEVNVLRRKSNRGETASPGAYKVLNEVKDLVSAHKQKLEETRADSKNFDQLIKDVLQQIKAYQAETNEWEEKQLVAYGYNVPPPLDPSLFDIYKVDAPAAATDLPSGQGTHESSQQVEGGTHVESLEKKDAATVSQPESDVPPKLAVSSAMDDLSIFDIGLSKETLRLLHGMKKPQQDKPTTKSPPISLPPAMQLAANDTTLEQSSCNETSLYSADGSHLSQRTLAGGRFYCGEDTNNLEPVLRLATNIQSCLDFSVGGSPDLQKKKTSNANSIQKIEISPGLFTNRNVSKGVDRDSTNTDEFNSIIQRNLKAAGTNSDQEKENERVSTNTDEIKSIIERNINQADFPKNLSNLGKDNERVSSNTDEINSIIERNITKCATPKSNPVRMTSCFDLPATPELMTVNLKELNAKVFLPAAKATSPVSTPEMESIKQTKAEGLEFELPATPELETVNLKNLLQKKSYN